jgi:hypothetical protein
MDAHRVLATAMTAAASSDRVRIGGHCTSSHAEPGSGATCCPAVEARSEPTSVHPAKTASKGERQRRSNPQVGSPSTGADLHSRGTLFNRS